jgi:anti-sigma regulatory factor (Ser/Thr protein kinase)
MPEFQALLGPTRESVAEARSLLRATLRGWHLDACGEIAELLTCELVTNVVRHVGTDMTLRFRSDPARLRVEVSDPSTDLPVLHADRGLLESGRGLQLVDRLATTWGVQLGDAGKTTWFELDVG